MNGSHFRRGETTFNCQSCGRRTRRTAVQSVGAMVCPQCYEIAGIENAVSDGQETIEDVRAEVLALAEQVRAKGGKPDVAFLNEGEQASDERKTNTQVVTDLMEFASTGPLMQAFIVQAIQRYAEKVMAASIEQLDTPLVSGKAWQDCAVEALNTINKHLGE